jgi:hypothetical protein
MKEVITASIPDIFTEVSRGIDKYFWMVEAYAKGREERVETQIHQQ